MILKTANPWEAKIQIAAEKRATPVDALDFHRVLKGATGAVLLDCSDGELYAVKGIHRKRELWAEQIVSHLGIAMEAPVASVGLVRVPQEMIDDKPVEFRHYRAGVSHGSLLIADCTDRLPLEPYADEHNRHRLAQLAILWGLVISSDPQIVRLKQTPESIFSVDHGESFPKGVRWSQDTLDKAPKAAPDVATRMLCGIKDREIIMACTKLRRVSDTDIAAAVASPPDEWGVELSHRVALAEFLAARRDVMMASFPGSSQGA